jgi:hypothetical protein
MTNYTQPMTSKIDFDALEAEYDDTPTFQPVAKPTRPVGSRADQSRYIKPRRDGSHKRMEQS